MGGETESKGKEIIKMNWQQSISIWERASNKSLKKIKLDLMTWGTFQTRQVVLEPPKSMEAQFDIPNLASMQTV